ncbi:MAG: hypothetical protein ACI4C7_08215 [Clostridia bacterium]
MEMPTKSMAEILVEVSKEAQRYKMIAERLNADLADLQDRIRVLEAENAALREKMQ